MACYYTYQGANFTSSSTPNTALLFMALKAGSTRAVTVRQFIGSGRDTARTNLNAAQFEGIKWTTTATAVNTGSTLTGAPTDPGFQAAKSTCFTCTGQGGTALTTGTGGPIIHASWTTSLTSTQPWAEYNQDAYPTIEGGATMSIDLRVSAPIASALVTGAIHVVE